MIVVVLSCLAMMSEPVKEPAKVKVPELNRVEREALVTAVNETMRKHIQAHKNQRLTREIEKELWGEELNRLKPVRIRYDHVNIAIVLSETDGIEEGIYVTIPISSYAPRPGKRFPLLKRLTTDEENSLSTLYHYKLAKNEKED